MRARPFATLTLALLIAFATCIGLASPAQAAAGWSAPVDMPCCPERAQPICAPACAQLCQGVIPDGWTPALAAQAIMLKFSLVDADRDGLRHGPEPPPPRSV